ncbi:MAG: rod shape-determining protein MreC [Bacteroidales bacterium]|jgi:rod shape-determining protein MreC|nr:rod shape-determining protein MreC [Bacteroidales bacterium]
MRGFIGFFKRQSYIFLFILLEAFSFYLIVANSNFQRTVFHSVLMEINGGFFSVMKDARNFFLLRSANDALAKENAILKEQLESSYFKALHPLDSSQYDTVYYQMYSYIPATVISNSTDNKENYVLLDAGRNSGVEEDMAVITSDGIVGIVKRVSPHFATVVSVLTEGNRVSAKLSGHNYIGAVMWDGFRYDEALMVDIPSHIPVHVGDKIETSGYSLAFPKGIPVGTVSEILTDNVSDFHTLKIKFSQNYKRLNKVYVVKNIYAKELKFLQGE